ncbi:MAG TPA: glycine zipper 2TM domain-containing protein [Woeseiaceae bacterium]|nr:glycine zipper 2TM domain-containing protein [Woeseiaceae bacterium]
MGRKAIVSGTVAVVLALAGAPAVADGYGRHGGVYAYAKVLSVQPNVRYVTVRTPVQECWEETRYYTVEHRPPGNPVGTLVGAVIGGVIGHQFGSGRGNDAATVAGVLTGAAVGSGVGRDRYYETTEYARPVRRCQTRYTTHEEERIDSYRVVYTYGGQKYATDMPYDPGDRVRIRVDVRPVH